MENSNSVRRVTRSQSRAAAGATPMKSVPATPVGVKKATPAAGRRTRKALADVTNDSPVAGLTPVEASSRAGGDLTPHCSPLCPPLESSLGTPGDEVLRAHCINMLQQAGGDHFKALRPVPSLLSQFTDSPTLLAAPTPANTPANVVWSSGAEPGSGPSLPVSYMVTSTITGKETPLVVLPEVEQNSTVDANWCCVPLGSSKTWPVKENNSPSDTVDTLPVYVTKPVLPLSTSSPILEVDLSTCADATPRALDFNSPEKETPRSNVKVYSRRSLNLAADKALDDHVHSTPKKSGMTDFDDDRWSVDVNVNSPPADSFPNETSDDLSAYTQLDAELTDSDEVSKAPLGEFVTDANTFSKAPEVEDTGMQLAGGLELVSTPLAANPHFVKFRVKGEGDGQGKVDRVGTPYVWQQRDSSTDGHFVEFDNDDDCDEDVWADCEVENDEDEDCDDFDESDFCDELCRGISHISMGGNDLKGLPAFTGTHKRFHYDSDDEVEEEVVKAATIDAQSPSVTRLKGLPTPQGKHLRFDSLGD